MLEQFDLRCKSPFCCGLGEVLTAFHNRLLKKIGICEVSENQSLLFLAE